MKIFTVIMAGGIGARFWPRSRKKTPKQLLKIESDNTMLEDTILRMKGLVEGENIYIITNMDQAESVKKVAKNIPPENIIGEPFGKNTAACIGLASVLIERKDPEAVVLTLAADHRINNIKKFQKTLKNAAKFAYESGGLITIGIIPTKPETGYGYIQCAEKETQKGIYKVKTFAEKPNLSTARRFIKSGDFLWNSGMFIWRNDAILSEIKLYMPELFTGLNEIKKAMGKKNFGPVLEKVYRSLKSISIDYGIMEKSQNVFLTKGDFDWSDVGSWEAVYEISKKDGKENVKVGDIYTLESLDSYIYSPDKFTALIGVENLVVINTDDALLICKRDHVQDVKQVVDYLKMNNRKDIV